MHKMNDLFGSVRSVQRYYSHSGIFQMDYSIRDKLAFSPVVVVSLTFIGKRTVRKQGLGTKFNLT